MVSSEMTSPAQPARPDVAVAANGLLVRREGHVVLDDLTFTVPHAQVTGLLGPSGCGKTTLMRTLVGVQVIDGGKVEVLGLPAGDPGLRPRVGYATQDPAVYRDLTLAENLRYFGTVLGLPRSRLADAIARTVVALDLGGLEGRLVGTFSGGQLARADLAVALLAKPDLLVLDEPTVGLDPVLRRDLWAIFRRLAAEGASLLVSSHVMDEAARCDQLLFMREGRFLAAASPDEILAATGAASLEAAFLAVVLVISLTWLGVQLPGSVVPLVVVAVLDALLGMSLGLFASAFARTEFQAVQFMPAFVLPQALLCGIIVARSQMTDVLRWVSDVVPLSYAVDAMRQISAGASWSGPVTRDIGVILGFTVAALAAGALTLRRRTR